MKSVTTILLCALGTLLVQGCGDDDDGAEDLRRDDGAWELEMETEGSLQNAAWSPEGDEILFTVFEGGYNEGPANLMVVDWDGGEPRTLVADGSDNVNLPGSSWNEETGLIVFSSSRDPHDEIFAIDCDDATGDEWAVTDRDDFMAYEPTLSPDGRWVVFESHVVDEEDNGVIVRFRVDGTGDYEALTDGDDDSRQPNWSPAGDKILFQRFDGSRWSIWVMNDDGTGAHQVTDGEYDSTDASFSPDGDHIVYSSDEGELDLANIYVVPTVGGETVRVTDWEGYDGAPSWSPDGSTIAFESYEGDPDDSEGTKIFLIDAPEM